MFGLTEGTLARAAALRAGKSRGVVLLRPPHKGGWLAGWKAKAPAASVSGRAAEPPAPAGPAASRNRT